MRLRIVVADDSAAWLDSVTELLEAEFEVIATASDGSAALERIRKLKPEVAVLDLEMPGLNGIQVTQEATKDGISSGVVICSVHRAPELVEAAAKAGARGYIFKNNGLHDLLNAVKTVARGGTCFPSDS